MEQQHDISGYSEGGSDSYSKAINEKSTRLRASCDSCTRAKLRCDQEKPSCARCTDRNEICNYSPMGRVGRPRRPATTTESAAPPCQAAQRQAIMRKKKTAQRLSVNDLSGSPGAEQTLESTCAEPETGDRLPPTSRDRRSTTDSSTNTYTDNDTNDFILVRAETSLNLGPMVSRREGKDVSPIPSTTPCPRVQDGVRGNETDLDVNSFGHHTLTSKITTAETNSLKDAGLDTMDLELDTIMDADFDFDVDFDAIMHPDSPIKQNQPSLVSPTPLVEVPINQPSTVTGQLENAWERVMSGTSELQRIISAIAPGNSCSSSSSTRCSCPNLIGRLQLFALHPRLAPHNHRKSRADRHSHSRPPLDLLVFLDDVVHQSISAVLSCEFCSTSPRVRLTLYLQIDWLVDVLRETLETDLPRFLSSHKGLDLVNATHSGEYSVGTNVLGHHVAPASKNRSARQNAEDEGTDNSWKHESNLLRLGSFCLEGELWQICIRELFKARLNRLSRVVERMAGHKSQNGFHAGIDNIKTNSLEKALVNMTTDVYSKIESLFGMIELCEA
ncbi:Putative zn(2)Cys(6) fungal-type DNA-binding domain-containing protein [Colletotrichum destructivum]|uniref:Zn(2)Cys(6) fungal-type DNA-binding domain-containing protein n=1 Tax=Colletotrichum destructivum TaxID=34406 RepID=A0AAX4I1S7_9PEZI|nr:Putative zn(2)Cys(6) fungal-type DNA-binding domain-containing protein [Colletotrichum destructivum]